MRKVHNFIRHGILNFIDLFYKPFKKWMPLHQKEEIPILVNGNGEIMWIGGYRPDERYKVNDNTKKVTIFELFKLT